MLVYLVVVFYQVDEGPKDINVDADEEQYENYVTTHYQCPDFGSNISVRQFYDNENC